MIRERNLVQFVVFTIYYIKSHLRSKYFFLQDHV